MINRLLGGATQSCFWSALSAVLCFLALPGCDLWRPPAPTSEEANKGLVVLYPGSFNTTIEMVGFYEGLKQANKGVGIEVVTWAPFLDHMIDPVGAQIRNDGRATEEANRLAEYKRAHPGSMVTLLGYSGGCWFAVLTAERMPADVSVDRVILMNAPIRKTYDLSAALAHTTGGIVNFWSPGDTFTRDVGGSFNLADSTRDPPAAMYSFDSTPAGLTQISYQPEWAAYGVYGTHTDYVLNTNWIRDVLGPWIATAP